MKTGIANLPLHYGKAPHWLFKRMKQLAKLISLAVIEECGALELLRRLSDPYWFQGLGCILGFDWHSSGLTTTVCGALKEGLKGLEKETGIFLAGGKGRVSRQTPAEIQAYFQKYNIGSTANKLIYASRLAAKVDSAAVQDGYQLYHHFFVFTEKGDWAVVQQGMNEENRWARRYHWLSEKLIDFVNEPHAAVCADEKKEILNMVAEESQESKNSSVMLSQEKPQKIVSEIKRIKCLKLPRRHALFLSDLKTESLEKILSTTYEHIPEDYESLLGIKGMGPKTVRALALLSELIFGAKPSHRDPAKYSFAHGGKDGYPFPVDQSRYAYSIKILKDSLYQAKLGYTDKLKAFKSLAKFERQGFKS